VSVWRDTLLTKGIGIGIARGSENGSERGRGSGTGTGSVSARGNSGIASVKGHKKRRTNGESRIKRGKQEIGTVRGRGRRGSERWTVSGHRDLRGINPSLPMIRCVPEHS
jgi:hypothetical protein